jgi:hypothetical protein
MVAALVRQWVRRLVPFDPRGQSHRRVRPDGHERFDRQRLIADKSRRHAARCLARSDHVKRAFDRDAKPRIVQSHVQRTARARSVDAPTHDRQQILSKLLELGGERRRVSQ